MSCYQIRRATEKDWTDTNAELYEDAERALIDAAPDGESIWWLRNTFNGSITVMQVCAYHGWRPTVANLGSYEQFYGAPHGDG